MNDDVLTFSNYIDTLDNFLFKFLSINFLLNIILYFFPNENLAIFIYFIAEIFFFIIIFKIYKNITPTLLPQMLVMFLINLTYINFIIAFLLNYFIFDITLESIFVYNFYCNSETFFLANSYLLFFGISILMFNRLLIPRSLMLDAVNKITKINLNFNQNNILILILFTIIVELYYFFNGIIGLQATGGFITNNAQDSSTWYTQLFEFILAFHLILNILFLKNFEKKKLTLFFLIFLTTSVLLNFIFFSIFERRAIIIFFIINLFIYFIFNNQKFITIKKFLIYFIVLIIIGQSWTFLGGIRSQNILAGDEGLPLKEIIKEGKIFSIYTDEYIRKSGRDDTIKNLSTRLIHNTELATIFYYNSFEKNRFLYGKLIFNYIIAATPNILYANKQSSIYGKGGEELISTVTSSPQYLKDAINSIHASSYIDFGLFGLILYPIMINLLILIIYKIITYQKLSKLSGIFIISLFIPLVSIRILETSPAGWLILIRNTLLFIIIFNYLFSLALKEKILKL